VGAMEGAGVTAGGMEGIGTGLTDGVGTGNGGGCSSSTS
jgi:hypothetical protein